MSVKSEWEARVSKALRAKTAYCFKPPDGGMYGGQPRVDFFFVTNQGVGGLCEVKYVREGAQSFDLTSTAFITAGQRAALESVACTARGKALLAVGIGTSEIRIYDWLWLRSRIRRIRLAEPVPEEHLQAVRYVPRFWPGNAFDPWL